MPAKTADLRPSLRKAYLFVVNNWAVDGTEVAESLKLDRPATVSLLNRLKNANLIVAEHINGERALTYQSYHDVNNEDGALDAAKADFATAFPAKVDPAATGRKGATGARYTPEQIKAGLAARKAGMKNADVAAAAGVKSPSYFAKTLKAIEHQATIKKVVAKKRRSAKTSTTAAK